ncbi:hypothetical protein LWC34_50355 [Kibdelosporangium philippinense]|uniref:Uncharacterized protein n=1 Tax=Kibdelosporangium philippinense TaxID=211113 RepID=A0ABS8ZTB0_9PSEU|nr:hypothetical protein [Kibdelosporangium philippinense]MCE7010955.1 hypothetical protein [Kibdelosporangium philippinense]
MGLNGIALGTVAALAASLLTTATASATALDRILTVGPGGQYTTVQAAADVAQPGDTVHRFRPGIRPRQQPAARRR